MTDGHLIQTVDQSRSLRRRDQNELVAGGALTLLGVTLVALASRYGLTDSDGLASGTLPAVWGAGLAVTGAVLAVRPARRLRQAATLMNATQDVSGRAEPTTPQRSSRRPLIIFVAMLTAAWLTSRVGLLPTLTALVLFLLVGMERRPVLPSVVVAASTGLGIHLVFVAILGVPLP